MLSVKSVCSFRKSALTMLQVSFTRSACAVTGQDSAMRTCAASIERGASGVWHDVFGKQGEHSRRGTLGGAGAGVFAPAVLVVLVVQDQDETYASVGHIAVHLVVLH
jgi:hypothetical protein